MPPIVSGPLLTFQSTSDKIDDLQESLDWLPDSLMDVALLKRFGINGKENDSGGRNRARSVKTEWRQTALRQRQEVITIDGSSVTLTVGDSNNYQINELIRSENETMRVTARPSGTTLTVVRGYIGAAAAHTAKVIYTLGTAREENSVPGSSVTETPIELFNYVQTFDVPVEVSNDQIMAWSVDGN